MSGALLTNNVLTKLDLRGEEKQTHKKCVIGNESDKQETELIPKGLKL